MGRKPESPAGHAPIKQASPSYQQPPIKPKQQPSNSLAPVSGGAHANEQRKAETTNGNNYYDSGVTASTTPYPSLSYSDQSSGGASTHPNGNGTSESVDGAQYLYAAASAVTAATAPNASAAGEQAGSEQNPLIAFASQATQHVAGQAADSWPAQTQLMAHNTAPANTWQDWTAAIADSQDRYSANALLTLGSGRPGDVGAGAVVDHVHQGDSMGAPHAGQWPLLLFHDGSGAASGA